MSWHSFPSCFLPLRRICVCLCVTSACVLFVYGEVWEFREGVRGKGYGEESILMTRCALYIGGSVYTVCRVWIRTHALALGIPPTE